MRDLEMFLAGMQPNAPLDTIQALDIVLRECLSNSNAIVQVGRSFFSDDFGRYNLDGGLDIWRGIYQSLCPTQMGLSLNLNTTATSFIKPVLVTQFASRLIGKYLQIN
ncbi:protein argonaute MEL1-like [Carex rostrata]